MAKLRLWECDEKVCQSILGEETGAEIGVRVQMDKTPDGSLVNQALRYRTRSGCLRRQAGVECRAACLEDLADGVQSRR